MKFEHTIGNITDQIVPRFSALDDDRSRKVMNLGEVNGTDVVASYGNRLS